MSSQRYPEEFRIEAVRQITEHGHTVADVSRRLGVSTHSLYKWLQMHQMPAAMLGQQQSQAEELRRLKTDAKDMLGYKHSGFSVDAGVCIEAHDRAALERLLRYCAIARVHRFPWSAYAKREANWCTAVPNSAASPPATSAVPRLMSCTSHRWS